MILAFCRLGVGRCIFYFICMKVLAAIAYLKPFVENKEDDINVWRY